MKSVILAINTTQVDMIISKPDISPVTRTRPLNRTRPVNHIWAVLITALLCHSVFAMESGIEAFGTERDGVRHVIAAEAAEILQKHPSVKVLDVRTGVEYNRGHITDDAVNLNYYSFSFKKQLEELDKNTTWLVHCRTGVRSGKSLPIMKSMGFSSIIHLDGGTSAWTKEGLPLKK